jgi:hypothetical protein
MLGGYIERYSILDKEMTGAALASRLDELQNTDFKACLPLRQSDVRMLINPVS